MEKEKKKEDQIRKVEDENFREKVEGEREVGGEGVGEQEVFSYVGRRYGTFAVASLQPSILAPPSANPSLLPPLILRFSPLQKVPKPFTQPCLTLPVPQTSSAVYSG